MPKNKSGKHTNQTIVQNAKIVKKRILIQLYTSRNQFMNHLYLR